MLLVRVSMCHVLILYYQLTLSLRLGGYIIIIMQMEFKRISQIQLLVLFNSCNGPDLSRYKYEKKVQRTRTGVNVTSTHFPLLYKCYSYAGTYVVTK